MQWKNLVICTNVVEKLSYKTIPMINFIYTNAEEELSYKLTILKINFTCTKTVKELSKNFTCTKAVAYNISRIVLGYS